MNYTEFMKKKTSSFFGMHWELFFSVDKLKWCLYVLLEHYFLVIEFTKAAVSNILNLVKFHLLQNTLSAV